MKLRFELSERDERAALQAVGDNIRYCVPADLSLLGLREEGYLVVGEERYAIIQDGDIKESYRIADAVEYKAIPLVGNVIIEAKEQEGSRIIARALMQHAARYAYLAQILTSLARKQPIRIYNTEVEHVCEKCGGSLIRGTRMCPKCISKSAAFKRLWAVSMGHWRMIILGIVLLFVLMGLNLLGPYFQKLLINSALAPLEGQNPNHSLFVMALIGMAVVLIGGQLLTVLKGRIMTTVSSNIAADLRKVVFDRLQSLSLGFLTSQRAGDIINRITSDTDRIRNLIQEICTMAILQVITLISVSILLFRTNPLLAVIVIIPAPLVAYLQFYIWRRVLKKLFHKQWRIFDKANSFLHDVLSGIRVVKSFGKEAREVARFRDYNTQFATASVHSEKVFSYLAPISNYLIQIGQYVVLLIGGYLIIGHKMNLGELVQFTGYASMVYGPLQWLMMMPRWVTNAVIAVDRVFSVIDEQPEIMDAEQAVKHQIQGHIEFRDVTFGYKSYEPVLKEINVEIKQGEMIGLVGHSGSGKSTMINLISRFYDVNEGQLLIDGVDIRSIQQEDLRSQIGVVLQETFLFSGTITENIRYSKQDATLEEIIQAARIANAHDFITQLPDGYDTRLEENGNNLSGGERQRIAIARAVLGNPRILILDEATASLDIETESVIQEALARVTENRTTIAIAHRLSTLRNADRLFVLEKGEIVEIGTHTELMEKQGIYYGLIMAQRNMSKKQGEEQELVAAMADPAEALLH